MKTRQVFPLLAWVALSLSPKIHAAVEVATDPVGFVSISVPADSDAVLAVPLYRTPVFRGVIQSISGNVVTVSASANWVADQFKQVTPTQNDTFAALIATGDAENNGKEGMIGKITANGTNTLTVQLDQDDTFAGVKTETSNPGAGDQIDVMAYWTPASLLGTSLPNGVQLLLFPTNQAGINIRSQTTLTMTAGAWTNGAENANNLQLFFGQGFVLRNATASPQVVSMVGSVPMATHRYVLRKNSSTGTAQDIRIGYTSPVPEIIGNLKVGFTPGDQLLVFDNAAAGKNKSSVKTLVYSGSFWYDGAVNVTTSFKLQPGQGYIFRRAPSASAGATVWATMQSYLR